MSLENHHIRNKVGHSMKDAGKTKILTCKRMKLDVYPTPCIKPIQNGPNTLN